MSSVSQHSPWLNNWWWTLMWAPGLHEEPTFLHVWRSLPSSFPSEMHRDERRSRRRRKMMLQEEVHEKMFMVITVSGFWAVIFSYCLCRAVLFHINSFALQKGCEAHRGVTTKKPNSGSVREQASYSTHSLLKIKDKFKKTNNQYNCTDCCRI